MRPTQARRFSISDIMILVAAAALAALLLRSYSPERAFQVGAVARSVSARWLVWRWHSWARGPGSCVAVPLSAAVIAFRLRPPRPRRSRLINQPGLIACLAVMAALPVGLAWFAMIAVRYDFQQPFGIEVVWAIITQWVDTAVLGAWLALALARRWRPERSWIDRLGRILGVYWVLVLFVALAAQVVEAMQRFLAYGGLA